MTVCLYVLRETRPNHPNLGLPIYVGIGSPARPAKHIAAARTEKGCPNRLLHSVITAHFALGVEPSIEILATFATRAEADAAEREAIKKYGRLGRDPGGILCNVAHGGDGPDSELMSDPYVLAKIGAASTAYWKVPGNRQGQSRKMKEALNRPAMRSHLSEAIGKALRSPEIRERHLAALRRVNAERTPEDRVAAAKKRSPEAKAKSMAALEAARTDPIAEAKRRESMRVAQNKAWADPEMSARRIASMKGNKKTMTPEAIAARQANARLPRSEETRAAQKAASDRNWADPTFRAERSASQTAAWKDPEKRANMLARRAEGIAASWKDPEVRAKRIAAIKAASERRKGHLD